MRKQNRFEQTRFFLGNMAFFSVAATLYHLGFQELAASTGAISLLFFRLFAGVLFAILFDQIRLGGHFSAQLEALIAEK